jgi:hypothetical protein
MKRLLLLLIVVATGGAAAHGAAASSEPVAITFDKQFDLAKTIANGTPTWSGTVSGDVTGTLETRLILPTKPSGEVEHVVFDFIVTAGVASFTARLEGVFNARKDTIIMNGVVSDGWLEGARVHEAGVGVDRTTSRYQGTLRVAVASAG